MGFDEPTILRLRDRQILCVMRTGHFSPLYASWSNDDGKTWTEPRYTGLERGCDPQLLMLEDGRILLSYGERFPTGSYLQPKKRGALVKFALSEDAGVSWRVTTIAAEMGSSYSTISRALNQFLRPLVGGTRGYARGCGPAWQGKVP